MSTKLTRAEAVRVRHMCLSVALLALQRAERACNDCLLVPIDTAFVYSDIQLATAVANVRGELSVIINRDREG